MIFRRMMGGQKKGKKMVGGMKEREEATRRKRRRNDQKGGTEGTERQGRGRVAGKGLFLYHMHTTMPRSCALPGLGWTVVSIKSLALLTSRSKGVMAR